jgi:hypothetical protein
MSVEFPFAAVHECWWSGSKCSRSNTGLRAKRPLLSHPLSSFEAVTYGADSSLPGCCHVD